MHTSQPASSAIPTSGYIRRFRMPELLGVSMPTIDRWVKNGKLPRPIKLSDFRYQRGRYIRIVHFFERGDNFSCGHTFGVQRQNLAVHLRNTRLVLLNQLRFKGIFTIARRIQLNLAIIAKQRF